MRDLDAVIAVRLAIVELGIANQQLGAQLASELLLDALTDLLQQARIDAVDFLEQRAFAR